MPYTGPKLVAVEQHVKEYEVEVIEQSAAKLTKGELIEVELASGAT